MSAQGLPLFLLLELGRPRIVAGRSFQSRVDGSERIDNTLGVFNSSICLRILILILCLMPFWQLFGFEATSLIAVLGATTPGHPFCAAGYLVPCCSGVMLVLSGQYKLTLTELCIH